MPLLIRGFAARLFGRRCSASFLFLWRVDAFACYELEFLIFLFGVSDVLDGVGAPVVVVLEFCCWGAPFWVLHFVVPHCPCLPLSDVARILFREGVGGIKVAEVGQSLSLFCCVFNAGVPSQREKILLLLFTYSRCRLSVGCLPRVLSLLTLDG